mgnify:FL=1
MKSIIENQQVLPNLRKPTRPQLSPEINALPKRNFIEALKDARISELLPDIPEIGLDHNDTDTSVMDDIILNLIWSNPEMPEIPELNASITGENVEQRNEKLEKESKIDEAEQKIAIKQFLNPMGSEESMVNRSSEVVQKNMNSLFRVAINSKLSRSLRTNED